MSVSADSVGRPAAGAWVHVLPAAGGNVFLGSLVEERDQLVVLQMQEPYFLATGSRVRLFCGDPGARAAIDATVTDPYAPSGAIFGKAGDWWPADTRASERYPARLRSGVRTPGSENEILGVTVNVSLGGLAVEVFEPPGDERIEVAVGLQEELEYLPCEVVCAREGPDTVLLRLRFVDLDEQQADYVARLVEDVKQHTGSPPQE